MINMKDLKPGMKVCIRNDLRVGTMYGEQMFVHSMQPTRGKIVTIGRVNPFDFKIKPDSCFALGIQNFYYTPEMVDYIVSDIPSIDELPEGSRIVTKECGVYILLNKTFVRENGYIETRHYDENLKCKTFSTLDIEKIYAPKKYSSLKRMLEIDPWDTPIWERGKAAKEMTVAEIEKALGYSIKVVKE